MFLLCNSVYDDELLNVRLALLLRVTNEVTTHILKLVTVIVCVECCVDSDVVRLIRRSPSIQRLVYVSCKLSGAKQNIIEYVIVTSYIYAFK